MKLLLKIYIILIILIQSGLSAFSQIASKENQFFFNHLYNFEFSMADQVLRSIDSLANPSQFNFLKSHFMRWSCIPIHEQNDKILAQYGKYLEASGNRNPETDYLYINSALLKAEYNYNQGNYYKAYQNGTKVYDLIKENLYKPHKQQEMMFLSSLYHYYYQFYQSENPVYASMMWLLKEGDKETGLNWLKIVAAGESLASTEALIYLSHIYLRLENKPDSAYKYSEKLHQLYPKNLKFYEVFIESAIATGTAEKAVELLNQKLRNSDKNYFRKYGNCYAAISKASSKKYSKTEKITTLKNALNFIEQSGGGNHLSSLLYYSLYQVTAEEKYLKQKTKHEVYKFVLTGYEKEK